MIKISPEISNRMPAPKGHLLEGAGL